MDEASGIKEGFLCPICHKDLRSPNNLIAHFQDLHSEEQDILKSIKGFYGKAKKIILKLDEQDLATFKNELTLENYYEEYSEPQNAGLTNCHTDYFKAVRRGRLDHRTAETNKLIIRLDKLLSFYGSDRKQKEQLVVSWLDGSAVTRCPSCAANFNITRRQHHCRLCGSVMCHLCSSFLPYEKAQTIVAPCHKTSPKSREAIPGKELESLRICEHCSNMLEHRRKAQIEQLMQPIICQLYTHLQNLKSQVQSQADLYQKMYNSLISGESTFQLQDAQSLKASIAKKAEMMDTLSKKIQNLPVDEECPKVGSVQNTIRRATSNYIKDYLVTLPGLPTLQELEQITKDRSLRYEDDSLPVQRATIKKVTVTTGWSPAVVENSTESAGDPLIEQISIVKSYIEQARKAHRFEEVASLEENLKLLERNVWKQETQKSLV